MTRHLATLRESSLLPPLTCALLNLHTFTFKALGRTHSMSNSVSTSHCSVFIQQTDSSCHYQFRQKIKQTIQICSSRLSHQSQFTHQRHKSKLPTSLNNFIPYDHRLFTQMTSFGLKYGQKFTKCYLYETTSTYTLRKVSVLTKISKPIFSN